MDMHDRAQVIAKPPAYDHLVLLFHGVGGSAKDLVPLGEALSRYRPSAMVVSLEAPHASELGRGWEWFSVIGIDETNRPGRIAQAMPLFLQAIAHWQQVSGQGSARTTLVGFSQGAIMSLESTQTDLQSQPLAHNLVALAGRLAEPARRAPAGVRIHLIHGEADGVVNARGSVDAARELQALGGDATLDLLPGLGHGIDNRMVARILDRLRFD